MDSRQPGRRKFLKNGAALAGLVVAAPSVWAARSPRRATSASRT
jgi:hypothetical protein